MRKAYGPTGGRAKDYRGPRAVSHNLLVPAIPRKRADIAASYQHKSDFVLKGFYMLFVKCVCVPEPVGIFI